MSANAEHSQPQSNYPPNRIKGLIPFEPGKSGNPGGSLKGANRIDIAYQKLLRLSPEEIEAFEPKNGAEIIAFKQFVEACSNKKSLAYAQEISNRTIGAVASKLDVTATVSVEVRREISITAYTLVYASKSREAAQAELDAIYDAKDEEGRKLAVIAAIEADEAAVAEVWEKASELVMGKG